MLRTQVSYIVTAITIPATERKPCAAPKTVVASQPSITVLEASLLSNLARCQLREEQEPGLEQEAGGSECVCWGQGKGRSRVSDGICGGSSEKGHVSHCTVLPESSS